MIRIEHSMNGQTSKSQWKSIPFTRLLVMNCWTKKKLIEVSIEKRINTWKAEESLLFHIKKIVSNERTSCHSKYLRGGRIFFRHFYIHMRICPNVWYKSHILCQKKSNAKQGQSSQRKRNSGDSCADILC